MKKYFLLFMVFSALIIQNITANEPSKPVDHKVIPVKTKLPEEQTVYPIAIIGAGAGGTMAVKRAVLNNHEVLLFAGAIPERRGSRGYWVRTVDNIPGLEKYERTILQLRNEALEDLVQGPLGHQLYLIEDSVQTIKKEADFFSLTDGSGHTYYAKYVVMATGMMDEQPHIQGSIRPILDFANGQTVAYCALCDGHRAVGKQTVVIGHSESAASVALLLVEKYQPTSMTILTNGQTPDFTPEIAKRLQDKNITIQEFPILEILGDRALKQLSGFKLENEEMIEAQMAFVSLGIRPNNQLALQLDAQVDENGLVITDKNGETSVENLFVIGDLRSNSMKQIYTAWQQAVESVQFINRRMRE